MTKALSFSEKMELIKVLADSIIANAEQKFRKLGDLIALTEDPKSVDIVLKACDELCRVFCEILPSYRLREDSSTTTVDDETGAKKGMQLSKEVKQLRDYESYLLEIYRKYL